MRQTEVTSERGAGAQISQVPGGANEADEGQVCCAAERHRQQEEEKMYVKKDV